MENCEVRFDSYFPRRIRITGKSDSLGELFSFPARAPMRDAILRVCREFTRALM